MLSLHKLRSLFGVQASGQPDAEHPSGVGGGCSRGRKEGRGCRQRATCARSQGPPLGRRPAGLCSVPCAPQPRRGRHGRGRNLERYLTVVAVAAPDVAWLGAALARPAGHWGHRGGAGVSPGSPESGPTAPGPCLAWPGDRGLAPGG